jgi:hypothetical protein
MQLCPKGAQKIDYVDFPPIPPDEIQNRRAPGGVASKLITTP